MKRKRTVKAHRKNPRQLELALEMPQRGKFTPHVIEGGLKMLKRKGGVTRKELRRRFPKLNDKAARRLVKRCFIQGAGLKVNQKREGRDTRYTVAARKRA